MALGRYSGFYDMSQGGGAGFTQPGQSLQQGAYPVASTPRPKDIWSTNQTKARQSNEYNQFRQQASPFWQMKQFDRPGVSRGFGTLANTMPITSRLLSQGDQAFMSAPLEDMIDNSALRASSELAQSREALALGELLARNQGSNDALSMSVISPILAALLGG